VETPAIEEMIIYVGLLAMQLVCGVEASYVRGRINHGDEEGSQEVHEENILEEEQREEVEFIAQVQPVGRQECRTRDEGDETGQTEERPERQEGDQPQAGDCDWIV
jgi:hypothetical protein